MRDDDWTGVDTALYVLFFLAAFVAGAWIDGGSL
jgi:hypothetical protein